MPHCPFVDCAFAGTARRAAYVPNPGRRLKPHVQLEFAALAHKKPGASRAFVAGPKRIGSG